MNHTQTQLHTTEIACELARIEVLTANGVVAELADQAFASSRIGRIAAGAPLGYVLFEEVADDPVFDERREMWWQLNTIRAVHEGIEGFDPMQLLRDYNDTLNSFDIPIGASNRYSVKSFSKQYDGVETFFDDASKATTSQKVIDLYVNAFGVNGMNMAHRLHARAYRLLDIITHKRPRIPEIVLDYANGVIDNMAILGGEQPHAVDFGALDMAHKGLIRGLASFGLVTSEKFSLLDEAVSALSLKGKELNPSFECEAKESSSNAERYKEEAKAASVGLVGKLPGYNHANYTHYGTNTPWQSAEAYKRLSAEEREKLRQLVATYAQVKTPILNAISQAEDLVAMERHYDGFDQRLSEFVVRELLQSPLAGRAWLTTEAK